MTRLVLAPVHSYWLVGITGLLLLGLWLWSRRGLPLAPERKRILGILRIASILLLIAILLRPTLVYTEVQRQPASVAVLIDRTRSMLTADQVGGRTRDEELRRTIGEAGPALEDLSAYFDVKLYGFNQTLSAIPFQDGKFELGKPVGDESAIGAALQTVLEKEAGKRIAAVILASDGAQRALPPRDQLPQNVAKRLKDSGTPIYTVAYGRPSGLEQTRDVSIHDLIVPRTVFVKNELVVEATLQADGFKSASIAVELLLETAPGKMTVVDTVDVNIPDEGGRQQVALSTIPETAGEVKLTVRAKPQNGELVLTNNELSTFVSVLAGGLRVLYLEGEVRSEQKWIYRALDASQDIQIDAWRLNARDRSTRPPEFDEAFQPGKYDVYMLGDVDSSAFEPAELDALAQRVEEGAGLIMLGGFHSFGPGGYQGTKLNDVLPIEMQRTERQDFDAPIVADLHLSGEIKMRPKPGPGGRHPVMALGTRDENDAAWAALPPLEGANRLRRLKPGATVLAEGDQGVPLLVEKLYGNGRVLAFAGDSTWHWALAGHDDEHRRFWRQIILWLAKKDEAAEGSVWVKLADRRYSPAARVEFTAGALDAEGLPVTGADFTASVRLPDGKIESTGLARQGDQALGTFLNTLAPGDYTVEVTGAKDGKPLGTGRSRFLVFAQDLELDNPAADLSLMTALAAMTGGRKIAPESLPELFRELEERSRTFEVSSETKRSLWDNGWVFAAFVAVLLCEWYLRKRWGLV